MLHYLKIPVLVFIKCSASKLVIATECNLAISSALQDGGTDLAWLG